MLPNRLTQEQIRFLDEVCPDTWTERNGVINVNDDVDISCMNLTEIPVQFGKVNGFFDCRYNKLTTLKGTPSTVNGYFDCDSNKLSTLVGGPKEVSSYYSCSYNQLTSLIGAPEICHTVFWCNMNQLTTLEGCPSLIKNSFKCNDNPDLHILYGIGIVECKIYYDARNDLNDWIIKENRKNILLSDRDIISWIQNNRRLEFLHKAPEKIAEYFSEYVVKAIKLNLC